MSGFVRWGSWLSMTIEKMIAGQRVPRNLLISETLRDYSYSDARGMGVRNKIIPLMRAHNGVEPELHMALKKSQLYSSLWQSCDELRGGLPRQPGRGR